MWSGVWARDIGAHARDSSAAVGDGMARELRAPQRPQNDRPQGGSAGDEIQRKASGVGCKQRSRHLSYKTDGLDSLLQAITRSF
jgi:hypothetical protein